MRSDPVSEGPKAFAPNIYEEGFRSKRRGIPFLFREGGCAVGVRRVTTIIKEYKLNWGDKDVREKSRDADGTDG